MDSASAEPHRSSNPAGPVWLFRLVFTCALAATAVVSTFFLVGVVDGSVSSFNMGLWLATLAVVAIVPLMGWHLRTRGRLRSAIAVLLILALPGLLYGLFILLVIGSGASWN